jgi:hypothetical protein
VVKIFGDFPFMLSLVEAFLGFFSRINFSNVEQTRCKKIYRAKHVLSQVEGGAKVRRDEWK